MLSGLSNIWIRILFNTNMASVVNIPVVADNVD